MSDSFWESIAASCFMAVQSVRFQHGAFEVYLDALAMEANAPDKVTRPLMYKENWFRS